MDGPWEFVVVDPTPLALPRVSSAAPASPAPVLVDTVDCIADGDAAHQFR